MKKKFSKDYKSLTKVIRLIPPTLIKSDKTYEALFTSNEKIILDRELSNIFPKKIIIQEEMEI